MPRLATIATFNVHADRATPKAEFSEAPMSTILIILVLFLLFGGGGYYGYRRRW